MGIAQLVEHLVVVQGAAGSSPVTHPKFLSRLSPFPKSTRELLQRLLDRASLS